MLLHLFFMLITVTVSSMSAMNTQESEFLLDSPEEIKIIGRSFTPEEEAMIFFESAYAQRTSGTSHSITAKNLADAAAFKATINMSVGKNWRQVIQANGKKSNYHALVEKANANAPKN